MTLVIITFLTFIATLCGFAALVAYLNLPLWAAFPMGIIGSYKLADWYFKFYLWMVA